jgi:SAM-dependent MidA family methyltransferase
MLTMPLPSDAELAQSQRLLAHVHNTIEQQDGWISFAQFMNAALYTPELGYYSGARIKFGSKGDFVTAPEISPLFGRAIARQLVEALAITGPNILEFGAGRGLLAVDILQELARLGALPEHYYILEISADLQALQREQLAKRLPEHLGRVSWLQQLPDQFEGVMLGNEVLDAMPVHLVRFADDRWFERGVAWHADQLIWSDRPIDNPRLEAATQILPRIEGYLSEINLTASAFIQTLAEHCKQAYLLLIDYGFPAREYYHPQRNAGTLMCHYRHYAHDNPLILTGLQDVTAHIDFTTLAEAAIDAGWQCAGYTTQAQFLINCGILDLLAETSPELITEYLPQTTAVQKLLSPSEMGELFKVIAFQKGGNALSKGFERGDQSHRL